MKTNSPKKINWFSYFFRADCEANRVVCSRSETSPHALILETHFPCTAEASPVRTKHLATICSRRVVIIILCNSHRSARLLKMFAFIVRTNFKTSFYCFSSLLKHKHLHISQRLSWFDFFPRSFRLRWPVAEHSMSRAMLRERGEKIALVIKMEKVIRAIHEKKVVETRNGTEATWPEFKFESLRPMVRPRLKLRRERENEWTWSCWRFSTV